MVRIGVLDLKIPKNSRTGQNLSQFCILLASQIYEACGICNTRPLQDMKRIYNQSAMKCSKLDNLKTPDLRIVGTLCSNFASMTFGNNAKLLEAGIHIDEGICATPDLIVTNCLNNSTDHIVILNEVETNTFECKPGIIARCLVSMRICKPLTSCILVNYSKLSM